jgi:hypothetical protein
MGAVHFIIQKRDLMEQKPFCFTLNKSEEKIVSEQLFVARLRRASLSLGRSPQNFPCALGPKHIP